MEIINEQLFAAQLEREALQQKLGLEKFRRDLDKRKAGMDYSRAAGGKAVLFECLEDAIDSVDADLAGCLVGSGVNCGVIGDLIRDLQAYPEVDLDTGLPTGNTFNVWDSASATFIALQLLLDNCRMPTFAMDPSKHGKRWGARFTRTALEYEVATRIQNQVVSNLYSCYWPDKEYRKGFMTRKLKEWYGRHSSVRHKQKVFSTKRNDLAEWFDQRDKSPMAEVIRWSPWNKDLGRKLAAKILSRIVETILGPDGAPFFEVKDRAGKASYYEVSPAGQAWMDKYDDAQGANSYVTLPMIHPPIPHTITSAGGYLQEDAAHRRALVSGGMNGAFVPSQDHVDFGNKLQSTPLRINKQILEVMEEMVKLGPATGNVGKFLLEPINNIPELDPEIAVLPSRDARKRAAVAAKRQMHKDFQAAQDEARKYRIDSMLFTARTCVEDERFYLPTFMDFRGRFFYQTNALNPQGIDPMKALLEFADPAPVDSQTEFWLKVGIANAAGKDKQSFEARGAYVDSIRKELSYWLSDLSMITHKESFWRHQDDPWTFLALGLEYKRLYIDKDPYRVTRARVAIDATCSGQQQMACLFHSGKTAAMVNLIPNQTEPADIYSAMLEVMKQAIKAAGYHIEGVGVNKLRAFCRDTPKARSKARKGGKGVVMCAQYGAGEETRVEAFYDKCELDGYDKHPFTMEEAKALYPLMKKGLDATIEVLDPYLKWIRGLVKESFALDPEKRHFILPVADGSYVVQRYPEVDDTKDIQLDHIGTKHRIGYTRKLLDEVDMGAMKSSTPANFIHACDAATLVLGLGFLPVPLTTTHDSVSGRPGAEMTKIQAGFLLGMKRVAQSSILEDLVSLNGLPADTSILDMHSYDVDNLDSAIYAVC